MQGGVHEGGWAEEVEGAAARRDTTARASRSCQHKSARAAGATAAADAAWIARGYTRVADARTFRHSINCTRHTGFFCTSRIGIVSVCEITMPK